MFASPKFVCVLKKCLSFLKMFRTFKNCSHFRKKFQISKFVHRFFLFMKYVWNYENFSRFFNLFVFSERMTISKLFIISKKYKKNHKCFKSAAAFCSLEFALYKFYSISFSWNVSVQIYQNFSNNDRHFKNVLISKKFGHVFKICSCFNFVGIFELFSISKFVLTIPNKFVI